MSKDRNNSIDNFQEHGYTCRVCAKRKPRIEFPGKGRRGYICKQCAKVPLTQRVKIQQSDEIFHYMRRSRITDENIARLQQLQKSRYKNVAELADLVLKVAQTRPFRKGRLKDLAQNDPALLNALRNAGLVMKHS